MLLRCDDDHENDENEKQVDDSTGTLDKDSVGSFHQFTTLPVYQSPQSHQIDCQANNSQTVLHYVITGMKPLKILQEILNWKPNLKIEWDRDQCLMALHMAVCKIAGNDSGISLDMVQCLIKHPNGYGKDYMFHQVRALHPAVKKEDYNLTAIEYLLNITDITSPDMVEIQLFSWLSNGVMMWGR